MKCGAVICLYDDHEYLRECVDAVASQLDKVLFLMSDVPWHGRGTDNRETRAAVQQLCREYSQCELIEGHWEHEIEQRNFGLDRFLEWGIDVYFLIDSDEIYRDDEFARIKQFIGALPQAAAFHIEWNTYWRKDYYRIEPREEYRPLIAVRPGSFEFNVIRGGTTAVRRTRNGVEPSGSGYNAVLIPPEIAICYHLSYARSDSYMQRKLETNSHAPDFITGWFESVWLAWTPDSVNLHPIKPEQYQRAVPESFARFPRSLKAFIKREREKSRTALVVVAGDDTVEWSIVLGRISSSAHYAHELAVQSSSPPRGCGQVLWIEHLRSLLPIIGERDLCLVPANAALSPGWLSELYTLVNREADAGTAFSDCTVDGVPEAQLILRETLQDLGFPRSASDGIYFANARRSYIAMSERSESAAR